MRSIRTRTAVAVAVIATAIAGTAALERGRNGTPQTEAITALAFAGSIQGGTSQTGASFAIGSNPIVRSPSNFDLSPPMSSIVSPPFAAVQQPVPLPELEPPVPAPSSSRVDPAVQKQPGKSSMPAPSRSFEGLSNEDNAKYLGGFVLPPDATGDVGVTDYVQSVNLIWAVYNKASELRSGFPKPLKTLWSGFSNASCANHSRGDAIVLYDAAADRWFLTHLTGGYGRAFQCIAVSRTSDPAGAYYRYSYEFSCFNDYGKFGVWSDAYYASFTMFCGAVGTDIGVGAAAFDRTKMLAGDPTAQMVLFSLGTSGPTSLLPSDLDGTTPPPPGSPNYFLGIHPAALGLNRLGLYKFHVDFATPSNSTFTGPTEIAVADFNLGCPPKGCVPQPPVEGKIVPRLHGLTDRLMQRLAYRRFAQHESLVVNHTVDVHGLDHLGIRWYEIRDPNGALPVVYQQGTYAPDLDHRWMGSIAMDRLGNIALGYSVSSASTFPSIRYAGRLVDDPPSLLNQAEVTLQAGGGSQHEGYGSSSYRWGDYTTMQVDPADDCTFWYVNQYYPSSHGWKWHTRIGSFRFPACR